MSEPFAAKLVGQPLLRIEDLRLLRGKGQFVDDLHREGMLHAAILRSQVAHGRLRAIRTDAAKALPGVRGVFTAADVLRTLGGSIPMIPLRLGSPQLLPFEQPVIVADKVRYVGEPLAIVVADSRALAEDALELIEVEIEPLPPVASRAEASANTSLLFEAQGSNEAITYLATKGEPDIKASYVRRERFSVHRHSAVTLEPRGLLAIWEGDKSRMTLMGAAKLPFTTRRTLAQNMDLPEECIEAIEVDVGGGFGVRGDYHVEDFLVPFAARRLGRPVKWIEDRLENLMTANHARECDADLEIACDRDGKVLALRGRVWIDCGAYIRAAATVQPRNAAQFATGPYRIPNVRVESTIVVTNKTPSGVYRGPGRFECDFFRERLFDLAADDLGIDRVEFRRRNLPTEAEMPYPLAVINLPDKKEALDGGDYAAALDRCLAEFDWKGKAPLQGKCSEDGRYHGLGVGCFIEGGGAGPRENARIQVEPDGKFSVYVGSANVGQGLETTLVQIAADALGVGMEDIRFFHGSTTYLKEGFGAYHSRSTVMGGSAILNAANNLKAEMRRLAQGRTLSLKDFAGLSADGTFENGNKHTYAYGAAAAHVAVDPGTGYVEVLEYVSVEDVGRVVNPLTATGQAVGAVVQGLGGCFLERLQYDAEGQFLSGSLADYLLPSSTDFPRIKAFVTGNSPSPNNPLGVKGGGEGGIVPVAGVVSNAVGNALKSLGVVPRDLPLTAPRVWELIRASRP